MSSPRFLQVADHLAEVARGRLDGDALLAIAMRERDDAPALHDFMDLADVVRLKQNHLIRECLSVPSSIVPIV